MIKLVAFGDFASSNPSQINIDTKIKNLIKSADVAVCNFEAPIDGPWERIPKSGPSLKQSSDSPAFLENLGFNMVLIANNHIMDYGDVGCFATIQSFNKAQLVGAGNPKEAYSLKIFQKDTTKVGVLSFCQYEFGMCETKDSSSSCGVAWINSLDVRDIIVESKNQVDYLLIFPHAGLEDIDAPLPEWRDLYRHMILWGADAIIGNHTHCPQGIEYFNSKPICYSLGNFYFDLIEGDGHWNDGICVELLLDDSIKVNVINFKRSGRFIKLDISDSVKAHNKWLQTLIEDTNVYNKYLDKVSVSLFPLYKYTILRGLGGVSIYHKLSYIIRLIVLMFLNKINYYHLINNFRCESHRWIIQRYLSNKVS